MISFLECLVSRAMKLSSFTNSLGSRADVCSDGLGFGAFPTVGSFNHKLSHKVHSSFA